LKNSIKYFLQRLLGFQNYLYVFALFKIRTLKRDVKERDFFHFLSLLKDGKGDVLDIGANVGIMTVHLAKKLPNTTVHAIEPLPDNLRVLKRVIGHFGLDKIKIHETAVGDATGEVEMILPHQGRTKMQGLSHVKHVSITDWNEGDEFKVPLHKLDDLINGQPVQGIKIDVENFEYYALKGGRRIIEVNRPIIYAELWDNENRTKCLELLTELNYQSNVIAQGLITPFDPMKHTNQNFIFLPN
jgi:FkbM family methyltransferase